MRVQIGLLGAAAVGGLALGLACAGNSSFTCASDLDCSGGVCAGEHCAFPDDTCESNLRYGDFAGPLAGLCVLPEDATGGPSTATGNDTATSTSAGDATDTGPVVDDTATDGGPQISTLFVDDDAGDFGGGTMDGVVYADGKLRLAEPGTAGTFTSRVFDAGGDVQWLDLSWLPDAPYAKALLDAGGLESGYDALAVSMDGNMLLLHFDETTPLGPDAMVGDASGHGNDGVITGTAAAATTPGVFVGAIDDPVDSYVAISTASGDFDFDTADFTWSLWFRISHDCATNNVFMGVEEVIGGNDLQEHLWMGCSDDAWSECPRTEDGVPHTGGVLRSQQGNTDEGVFFCGPDGIGDGQWHHMAVVKQGHESATVTHWVDGALVSEISGTFAQPILLQMARDFAVGGFSDATYPTSGELDDVAIWTRALTEDELLGLYTRGASRVGLEVRVCTQADCADDPPFRGGPDLISGELFTDPANATSPGSAVDVSALNPGRWVQYRVRLEATATSRPPAITFVQISGEVG